VRDANTGKDGFPHVVNGSVFRGGMVVLFVPMIAIQAHEPARVNAKNHSQCGKGRQVEHVELGFVGQ